MKPHLSIPIVALAFAAALALPTAADAKRQHKPCVDCGSPPPPANPPTSSPPPASPTPSGPYGPSPEPTDTPQVNSTNSARIAPIMAGPGDGADGPINQVTQSFGSDATGQTNRTSAPDQGSADLAVNPNAQAIQDAEPVPQRPKTRRPYRKRKGYNPLGTQP